MEKDKFILEKEKALGEKDKSILEKEKALGEKDKSILEKEKALEEKDNTIALAIRQLFAGGTKVEELAALFRLTKEEIHSMLGEKN
jgi:hypothetical protein